MRTRDEPMLLRRLLRPPPTWLGLGVGVGVGVGLGLANPNPNPNPSPNLDGRRRRVLGCARDLAGERALAVAVPG